jgi:hypothetical protein
MPAKQKTCEVCHSEFYARSDARFCSPECRSASVVFLRHPHLLSPVKGTTDNEGKAVTEWRNRALDAENMLQEIYAALAEEGFDSVTDALEAVTNWRNRAALAETNQKEPQRSQTEINAAIDEKLKKYQ